MRRIIIAAAVSLSAGAAHASSIELFKPTQNPQSSITEIGCQACARAAAEAENDAIDLAPGAQIIEFREVDGKRRMFRTENLLGGAPITMMTTPSQTDLALYDTGSTPATAVADAPDASTDATAVATAATIDAARPVTAAMTTVIEDPLVIVAPDLADSENGQAIDPGATTAALAAEPAAMVVAPETAFDASKFDLRLN